jgi:hypothetical protein
MSTISTGQSSKNANSTFWSELPMMSATRNHANHSNRVHRTSQQGKWDKWCQH